MVGIEGGDLLADRGLCVLAPEVLPGDLLEGAQVRVSAAFDEMEPIIDELEPLCSTEERDGGPQGVVWVMLRK